MEEMRNVKKNESVPGLNVNEGEEEKVMTWNIFIGSMEATSDCKHCHGATVHSSSQCGASGDDMQQRTRRAYQASLTRSNRR